MLVRVKAESVADLERIEAVDAGNKKMTNPFKNLCEKQPGLRDFLEKSCKK